VANKAQLILKSLAWKQNVHVVLCQSSSVVNLRWSY